MRQQIQIRPSQPIIDAEVRQVRRINGMGKVVIAMWLLFAVVVAVSWSSAGVLLVGGFVAGALLTAVTAVVVWLTIR